MVVGGILKNNSNHKVSVSILTNFSYLVWYPGIIYYMWRETTESVLTFHKF